MISGFDHVALPTSRPEELIGFYERLGFQVPDPKEWRDGGLPFFVASLGSQKINFHAPALFENPDFSLRGPTATPGCGDLCFVWEGTIETLEAHLAQADAPIVAGPTKLRGGRGEGTSLYTRDPDQNLLEFIVYEHD